MINLGKMVMNEKESFLRIRKYEKKYFKAVSLARNLP